MNDVLLTDEEVINVAEIQSDSTYSRSHRLCVER
jgi:hypothetical protein